MANVTVVKGASYAPYTAQTLAAAGFVADAVGFDNAAGLMTAIDLRLNVTIVSPAAGTTLSVYMSAKMATTVFPAPGGSAALPPASYLVGTYVFTGAVTTVIDIYDIPMTLPYGVILIVQNNSATSITINTSLAQPKTIAVA